MFVRYINHISLAIKAGRLVLRVPICSYVACICTPTRHTNSPTCPITVAVVGEVVSEELYTRTWHSESIYPLPAFGYWTPLQQSYPMSSWIPHRTSTKNGIYGECYLYQHWCCNQSALQGPVFIGWMFAELLHWLADICWMNHGCSCSRASHGLQVALIPQSNESDVSRSIFCIHWPKYWTICHLESLC